MKSIIIIIALTGICAVGAWAATLPSGKVGNLSELKAIIPSDLRPWNKSHMNEMSNKEVTLESDKTNDYDECYGAGRRVALNIGEDYVIPKLGVPQYSKDVDFRIKRQSNATTTARPRKDRPSNVFKLISVLISETRNDTSRAFNEIGNLFNSQFAENTLKPTKNEHAVSSTTPDPSSESDEDNEITTTTEPYRITREEFFGILRSNVRGLMRLFQKELGNALRDTTKNARKFGKEFRNAIMPYVT